MKLTLQNNVRAKLKVSVDSTEYNNMLTLIDDLATQVTGSSLTDLQRAILTDCWQDSRITYEAIANKHGYSVKYIKQDVGPKLWKLLSIICSEKVKKNNFKSAVERLFVNQQSCDRAKNNSSERENYLSQHNKNLSDTVNYNFPLVSKQSAINLTEAPDTSVFFGRAEEIDVLRQLSSQEFSNLIIILGMGGIGKTHLAAKVIQEVKHNYDYIFWRSLTYNADYEHFIIELLTFLSPEPTGCVPTSDREQLDLLIGYLRQNRCLIVLDNLETILAYYQIGSSYRVGYEKYSKLLQIIGQCQHRSLLMITSREKPREINIKQDPKVHCYYLSGLDANAGRQLLQSNGCTWSSEAHCDYLLTQYAGNPLALKIASSTIQYLFEGDLSDFVAQKTFVLSGVSTLLAQQIDRLSDCCKTMVYWLTILVNPTSFKNIKRCCYPAISNHDLIESLETLLRRGIIEKKAAVYRLQPMVQEYLTEQIIKICHQEILGGEFDFLNAHALKQIDSEEYVEAHQVEFIIRPLLDRCLDSLNGKHNLVAQLDSITNHLQTHNALNPGYAVGNIINLLSQLNVDLACKDFSNLIIWQADLRKINLRQVNFSGSDLGNSVFSEQLTNVLSLDFSPDGKTLAAGDSSGQLKIWSIAEQRLKQIYTHHVGWIFTLAFSPDGCFLASGSSDRTVVIWDIQRNCLVHRLHGHEQRIRCVVFSPCGTILASSSSDRKIKLWSVATGRCLQTLSGHTNHVWTLAFSSDGTTIASGSEDRTIALWSVATGKCLTSFIAHQKWIRSLAFHPQDNVLVSGGGDSTIKLWDLDRGKCIKSFTGHTQRIRSVAFSPNGQSIASGSGDNTIRFWNYQTGECERVLHGHSSRLTAISFSPSGQILASSGEDKSIRLWQIPTGKIMQTWQGYNSWFQSVGFSPDGRKLVSGSENHQIEIWDLNRDRVNTRLKLVGHQGWVCQAAFSPQQDKIVSCSSDRTIKLWHAETGKCLQTLRGHSHWIRSVAFSASGGMLVSGGGDNVVKIWDVECSECQQSLFGHQGWIWTVAFSPDETLVASGSEDKTICLWNVAEQKLEKILTGHKSWVQSVAFSPDGQTIVSGSCDRTVKLWRVSTGECMRTFSGHTSWVQSVAFSPDGQTIVSGSCDRTVKLWRVSTGECLQTFHGHTSWIWSVAFSPDGQTIVSGSQDESIKLWNLSEDVCARTLRNQRLLEGTNIKGVKGLNSAQIDTLKALGARDGLVSSNR